jgi:hypothetical protein
MSKTVTWFRFGYAFTAALLLQACAAPRANLTDEKFTAKCATANADLRMLRDEKDISKLAVNGQAAPSGGTDAGAVVSVQIGPRAAQSDAEYQVTVDRRIAAIKRDCQPLLLGSVR